MLTGAFKVSIRLFLSIVCDHREEARVCQEVVLDYFISNKLRYYRVPSTVHSVKYTNMLQLTWFQYLCPCKTCKLNKFLGFHSTKEGTLRHFECFHSCYNEWVVVSVILECVLLLSFLPCLWSCNVCYTHFLSAPTEGRGLRTKCFRHDSFSLTCHFLVHPAVSSCSHPPGRTNSNRDNSPVKFHMFSSLQVSGESI